MYKKSDLKTGTIVKLRDGSIMMLMLDVVRHEGVTDMLIDFVDETHMTWEEYDENLTLSDSDSPYDIVKVYCPSFLGYALNYINGTNEPLWDWVRPEKRYHLVYPQGMYHKERVLIYGKGKYWDIDLSKTIPYGNVEFTQDQIDTVPFDTSFFYQREIVDKS